MRMVASEDRLDVGVAARVRSFHFIGAPWAAIVFLFFRADKFASSDSIEFSPALFPR